MEEPKRISCLDVLQRNLRANERKIKANIKMVNEEFFGKTVISGLLLFYPTVFLHMIEGYEEAIQRHLTALFSGATDKMIGRIISMPPFHNANKQLFLNWYSAVVLDPPVLLDEIESHDLPEIMKQIKNLLFKTYSLGEYLTDNGDGRPELTNAALMTLSRDVPNYLPEITAIDFLFGVESKVLPDLRTNIAEYRDIPVLQLYNDRTWPPPDIMIPNRPDEDLKQDQMKK
ncbi:hypothetical protein TKK_0009409 [Trichogramma kaykai]